MGLRDRNGTITVVRADPKSGVNGITISLRNPER